MMMTAIFFATVVVSTTQGKPAAPAEPSADLDAQWQAALKAGTRDLPDATDCQKIGDLEAAFELASDFPRGDIRLAQSAFELAYGLYGCQLDLDQQTRPLPTLAELPVYSALPSKATLFDRAARLVAFSVATSRQVLAQDNPELGIILANAAQMVTFMERYEEVAEYAEPAAAILAHSQHAPWNDLALVSVLLHLARARQATGDLDGAAAAAKSAYEHAVARFGAQSKRSISAQQQLAWYEGERKNSAEACALMISAMEHGLSKADLEHFGVANTGFESAVVMCHKVGEHDQAIAVLGRVAPYVRSLSTNEIWGGAWRANAQMGNLFSLLGDVASARTWYDASLAQLHRVSPQFEVAQVAQVLESYAAALEKTGDPNHEVPAMRAHATKVRRENGQAFLKGDPPRLWGMYSGHAPTPFLGFVPPPRWRATRAAPLPKADS